MVNGEIESHMYAKTSSGSNKIYYYEISTLTQLTKTSKTEETFMTVRMQVSFQVHFIETEQISIKFTTPPFDEPLPS